MQRLRSELESERTKRSGIEVSSKNEILLKQAYETLDVTGQIGDKYHVNDLLEYNDYEFG
jgi:hypothetical protein